MTTKQQDATAREIANECVQLARDIRAKAIEKGPAKEMVNAYGKALAAGRDTLKHEQLAGRKPKMAFYADMAK